MTFIKTTETDSSYHDLEKMTAIEILQHINDEDATVALSIKKILPQIEKVINIIVDKLKTGGRLFYIGAGTSGRLGIVDASECPPTFGVPYGLIIAIIAGGNKAITQAVEFAEDNVEQGWIDLQKYKINTKDVVLGIAASGTTPYVIGALEKCNQHKITTTSISCNLNAPISAISNFAIEVIVGPEFVTGSTRMKSGTAQKLILNMISTTIMIKLGRVEDNKMVNMQLTNQKLVDRGVKMLMKKKGIKSYSNAKELLLKNGTVKKAIENYKI